MVHIYSVHPKTFRHHFPFMSTVNGRSCMHKLFPIFVTFVTISKNLFNRQNHHHSAQCY